MEKKFTSIQIAQIKRTAQNVQKYTTCKAKLQEKITKLQEELNVQQAMIDSWQGPVKLMTGGFTTEDLINRVVSHVTLKDGTEGTITKYELKYPETVIPEASGEGIPEETNEVSEVNQNSNITL